jgi:hypothetical protein
MEGTMPSFGSKEVSKQNIVKNAPPQPKQLGKDSFTAKPFTNMVKGAVGKGAPIDTGDRK